MADNSNRKSASFSNGDVTDDNLNSTRQSENKSEPEKSSFAKKVCGYMSQTGKCIWSGVTSHLGLLIILVGYSFAGAAMMQLVEDHYVKLQENNPNPLTNGTNITDFRQYFAQVLLPQQREIARNLNNTRNVSNNTRNVTNSTRDVRDNSREVTDNSREVSDISLGAIPNTLDPDSVEKLLIFYDAQREIYSKQFSKPKQYNYWEWLLFCLTVYSTIGYGAIVPSTSAGRIATMVYATIGVPLFLLTMGKVGKLFTKIVKFLWSSIRKLYYLKQIRRIRKARAMQSFGHLRSNIVPGMVLENITVPPSSNPEQAQTDQPQPPQSIDISATTTTSGVNLRVTEDLANAADDNTSYVSFSIDDKFNLNPLVAILIASVYIILGAIMYAQWEKHWSYQEAFYFIFISVSTIGFGDVVPTHPKFFLLSSVYILFGLALVAMVINVLMEFFDKSIQSVREHIHIPAFLLQQIHLMANRQQQQHLQAQALAQGQDQGQGHADQGQQGQEQGQGDGLAETSVELQGRIDGPLDIIAGEEMVEADVLAAYDYRYISVRTESPEQMIGDDLPADCAENQPLRNPDGTVT